MLANTHLLDVLVEVWIKHFPDLRKIVMGVGQQGRMRKKDNLVRVQMDTWYKFVYLKRRGQKKKQNLRV